MPATGDKPTLGQRSLGSLRALQAKAAQEGGLSPQDRARAHAIMLAVGGASEKTRTGIDNQRAAQQLGISVKDARSLAKMGADPGAFSGNQVFTSLTGRSGADVSGAGDPRAAGSDMRGMLQAVAGKGSGGIDTAKAAKKLGVSQRTVQRWIKTSKEGTGQRPSAEHAKKLTAMARRANSTKKGRAEQAEAMRQRFARGGKLGVTGFQGPSQRGSDYQRWRTVSEDISPEQAEAMINAWEEGGEAGFQAWAQEHLSQEYADGWMVERAENLTLTPHTRGF